MPKINKRAFTTKDVALLDQLFKEKQLILAPEFQRNSVWPPAAKAYLIDTILNDRPMPLFFFQRGRSAQTGRTVYSIIDGQQRLRAIFDFLDDRFSLTASGNAPYAKRRFSQLKPSLRDRILTYDIVVEELSGYDDNDIRDIFVRMNKYVVKLSRQELRHAKAGGAFHKFVERVAKWPWWRIHQVFSRSQLKRMRAVEFAAEAAILLIEGPQDKKASIDLYYEKYNAQFDGSNKILRNLKRYLDWVDKCLPKVENTRYRKPVDLYSLLGAINRLDDRKLLPKSRLSRVGKKLLDFEKELAAGSQSKPASNYAVAASRQTDNIAPRNTRIDVLFDLIRTA